MTTKISRRKPLATSISWQRPLRIAAVVITIGLVLVHFLHSSGSLQINGRPVWGTEDDSNKTGQQTQGQFKESQRTSSPSSKYTLPEPTRTQEPAFPSSPSTLPKQSTVPGGIPGIPGKVWQTAKDNDLDDNQLKVTSSWLEKNPSFRYELLTDDSGDSYVRARFGATRPDIVSLYTSLQVAILKADLLRYLILLADGGIYSDLDVTCEKEVSGWLPAEIYAENSSSSMEIGLVVGLEFDIEWRGEGSGVHSQLTNWVFAARPGSRHLLHVVNKIVKELGEIARDNGVGPDGITLEMISDVVVVTGPKKMTLGIVESLSKMLGRTIDDRDIAGGKAPRVIGDVVVMPGNAFAAAQNGFPDDQGDRLVTHHYAGSWKGEADAARENRKKKEDEEVVEKLREEIEAAS